MTSRINKANQARMEIEWRRDNAIENLKAAERELGRLQAELNTAWEEWEVAMNERQPSLFSKA